MIDFDFHVHSKYSPCARQTVEEVFLRASQANLTTIAITDHDTIAAYKEVHEMREKYGIHCIPGIEVSTMIHSTLSFLDEGIGIHVLGLNIDLTQDILDRYYIETKIRAKTRRKKLFEYLETSFGIDLGEIPDSEKALRIRLCEKNIVASEDEAKKYLKSKEIIALFPKYHMSIPEAIDMIHELHGLAILAHPFRGENHLKLNQKQVDELIDFACTNHIDGLEVFHSDNFEAEGIAFLLEKVKEKHLLVSLGSDRHFFEDKRPGKYFIMEDRLLSLDFDFENIKRLILKEEK